MAGPQSPAKLTFTADKDYHMEHEDKKKPNLKVLQSFRMRGTPVQKGSIVAKADFPEKQDWLNLLHMPKPRVEETAEKPKVAKADVAMPGA